MRLVLDNCVHVDAAALFPAHFVRHARELRWQDLSNGKLIEAASKEFDVLVTVDKKIRYEHRLDALPISILVLNTRYVRLRDLQSLSPHLEQALGRTREYRLVIINVAGEIECLGRFTPPPT